jgi:ribosomal protein S27AE
MKNHYNSNRTHMTKSEVENVDEALEECHRCGESVLAVYVEDGSCHRCRE